MAKVREDKPYSFRCDPALFDQVRDNARHHQVSAASVIRTALERYLSEQQKTPAA